MKLLGLFLTLIAVAASAAELASSPPPQAQPVAQAVAQAPARAAVVVETRAAEPRLPVRELPTQPWLLLLAGAAFAGWMAHRRLSYF